MTQTETTVTLASGREVGSWSPEWKQECLDRHLEAVKVLAFSARETRIDHLDAYERRLGRVARERLEVEVMRIWDLRKARLRGENV